ncbi:hypothetical protein Slu03_02540 [Sediminihabitans luteus]|nr:hypothetical protein Slu03_02540 [Sediminihabitans luteus]
MNHSGEPLAVAVLSAVELWTYCMRLSFDVGSRSTVGPGLGVWEALPVPRSGVPSREALREGHVLARSDAQEGAGT